jgi:hypothetical protein
VKEWWQSGATDVSYMIRILFSHVYRIHVMCQCQ